MLNLQLVNQNVFPNSWKRLPLYTSGKEGKSESNSEKIMLPTSSHSKTC